MEKLNCRLLPYALADGPHNMAADEALLESALGGTASLRFYGWSEATLSLGYFQPAAVHEKAPRLAKLPFVRRPTGGDAIVHHFELTYALALPAGSPWQAGEPWLCRMHRVVAAAIQTFGAAPELQSCASPSSSSRTLCFSHPVEGDVLIGGSKVVGSAQRRRKGALLQHGSVLLMVSPFAPQLPGIHELTGHSPAAHAVEEAIKTELVRTEGWALRPEPWSDGELHRIKELTLTRYSQDEWNRKR